MLVAFTEGNYCALYILKGSLQSQAKQLEKIALGVQLGGYEATRFKNAAPKPPLQSLAILQKAAAADSAGAQEAITRGSSLAKGNLLARSALSFCHHWMPQLSTVTCLNGDTQDL